jgi:endonuclease YncB( thermonuclease family)
VLGRLFADKININQSMIDNHLAVEYFGQSKEELEAGHMANRQILIDEKKINLDL